MGFNSGFKGLIPTFSTSIYIYIYIYIYIHAYIHIYAYVFVNNIAQHGPTGNKHKITSIVSGFRRRVNGICALLTYYAAYDGDFSPTFWDNCSETSVRNYHHTLRNIPEERRSHKKTYVQIHYYWSTELYVPQVLVHAARCCDQRLWH